VRWLTFLDGDPVPTELCRELILEGARVAVMNRGERMLQAMDDDQPRPRYPGG
jgi:hypothetical protein